MEKETLLVSHRTVDIPLGYTIAIVNRVLKWKVSIIDFSNQLVTGNGTVPLQDYFH